MTVMRWWQRSWAMFTLVVVLLSVQFLDAASGKQLDPSDVKSVDIKHSNNILDLQREGKWRDHDSELWSYKKNSDLVVHLKDLEKRCSKFIKIEKIGESTSNSSIYAIRVSSFVGDEGSPKAKGLPKVKVVGNLHGDEPTGRVLTVALAEWLCEKKDNEKASDVLHKVDLWLIPTLNPDGFSSQQRENANGVDLNRDFPDRFAQGSSNERLKRTGKEQKETNLLMDWTEKKGPFVSSLAIHEGALVANYPWDGTPDKSTRYEACPDDVSFKYFATQYAKKHRKMSLPSNKEFPDGGTTNGAAWYPIYGSMQDWNYISASCLELTLEVSLHKWPDAQLLPNMFEDNRDAMIDFFLRSTYGGFTGIVYGIHTSSRKTGKENIPISATIRVDDSPLNITSNPETGTFYRPLAPGRYAVNIAATGFKSKLIQIEIPEDGSGLFERIYLNMQPSASNKSRSALSVGDDLIFQSGVVIFVACGITLLMLWWIHIVLVSRYLGRPLMKILKK